MNRTMKKATTEIVTKKTKTSNLRIKLAEPGRCWYRGSLIVLHGYPRDVATILTAAIKAANQHVHILQR